jgi:hypothetical protein
MAAAATPAATAAEQDFIVALGVAARRAGRLHGEKALLIYCTGRRIDDRKNASALVKICGFALGRVLRKDRAGRAGEKRHDKFP